MTDFPPRIPLGDWIDTFTIWVTTHLNGFFSVVKDFLGSLYDGLESALQFPSFWVIIAIIAVLALIVRGWQLALAAVVGLLLIVSLGQWENAMKTLALVLVAAGIAVVISVPLGILAARSEIAAAILRPILDFLQTMPAMVYLIPAMLLFSVGVVPGIFATVLFALAPGVRMTELGIRNVDSEVVEAGYAFGSPSGRILRQIQLPLAMPSIMAGINQVIMLSLSMVVIAGMVGAGGLGGDVMSAITRLNVGLGFEAGLSVVVLAILLDRITGALGNRKPKRAAKQAAAADA